MPYTHSAVRIGDLSQTLNGHNIKIKINVGVVKWLYAQENLKQLKNV